MRTLSIIILTSVLSIQLLAQNGENLCAAAKKAYYSKIFKTSQIQYPEDENIDVTYYKLNLNINYASQQISGIVTVDVKSTVADLGQFFLDLQDVLTVDSVTSGSSRLRFTHSQNKISITLSKSFSLGKQFSVKVFYHGHPGSSGFGSFEFGDHNGQPAIYTLSEPYGASDWWPSKDTPADKVDSSAVWVTSDSSFYTVSNGSLEEVINNNDGTKTYKWKNHHPIANYLISLAMANYAIYKNYFVYALDDTMEVINYNYPENLTAARKNQLDETVSMLQIYSNLFGPYPYLDEKYGHAEFGWGGGMEHQTVSSMGAFGTTIQSHELAHQWFGDKVTCKDWHHIWLNEGFATYSEALYQEFTNGKGAYNNEINFDISRAKSAVGTIYVQDINSIGEIFNGARSYSKGSVVLHMLRGIVSDTNFFNILKAYLSDPQLAYGVATTEDFQRVAQDVSGQDLNYFFQEWIYGEDYPNYTFDWGYTHLSGQQYQFNFNVSQANHSNPTFFTMPIQVKVTTTFGDTLLTVFNDQKIQNFKFEITGEPQNISIDPNNLILKEIQKVTTGITSESKIVNKFRLFQNYPNPFNPTTTIKYSVTKETHPFIPSREGKERSDRGVLVTLNVYDLLGRKVTSLVNKMQQPGNYKVEFDASSLPSGIYYYRIKSGTYSKVKKMILLK
ncbi:aminopeptidase N [bacterium BMS3Abin04]|nr:aminopeptidase N [bacterium BMS3Abin04]